MDYANLKDTLNQKYEKNSFVNLLHMQIVAAREGEIELSMPIQAEIHTNLYGVAHGGSLASLADTAMGIACATFGKRVVTLEMNINFLRGVPIQPAIRVIHNGSRTIVTECDIYDEENQLMAKARGTFFVIGRFEGA